MISHPIPALRISLAIGALLMNPGTVQAQWPERLLPGFSDSDQYFGSSVALHDTLFVSGAPGAGVVMFCTLDPLTGRTLTCNGALNPTDPAFGSQVAATTNRWAAIGTDEVLYRDLEPGTLTTTVQMTLETFAPVASVALDQDLIAYGSPSWTDSLTPKGQVLIWRATPGIGAAYFVQQLEGAPRSNFGASLALDDDLLVVGAPQTNASTGAAHLFQETVNGWTAAGTLTTPAGGVAGDLFGKDVAVQGDLVAVGAPGDSTGATEAGIVHLFAPDQTGAFRPLTTVSRPGRQVDFAHFGTSVALYGDLLVVGAPDEEEPVLFNPDPGVGRAYLFRIEGSTARFLRAFDHPISEPYASFGSDVAIDELGILVGTPNEDSYSFFGETDSGACYQFAGATPMFSDGFEGGDTSRWSAAAGI